MNEFAGPIAEDIRLADTKLQDKDMEAAAIYYRDMAMALSEEVSRDANGNVVYVNFDVSVSTKAPFERAERKPRAKADKDNSAVEVE